MNATETAAVTAEHVWGRTRVEYRVDVLLGPPSLECRVLDSDGRPYDERWWPVPAAHLDDLRSVGSRVIERLGLAKE